MRGRVPRIQMNINAKDKVFSENTKSLNKIILVEGRNTAEVNILIAKILVYSAIKIKANGPPLYSVLNPETNSDSPSAISNGVRLVSANIVTSQIKNMGKIIIKFMGR